MPCFHPRKGYRSKTVNPSGKRSITFNPKEAFHDLKIDLPCGQCHGCRLERSRQWAVRCVHESMLHAENCFITLTYDKEHLPKNGSLDVKHFQDFMKRLRFHTPEKKVRFFHCGEYGEMTARPHYHALLFGLDLRNEGRKIGGQWTRWPDRKVNGVQYYRSETLERLWTAGHSMVGELNFESAAYVARYILKKATGPLSKFFYQVEDEETGEMVSVAPEYVTMSRRPGIAKTFYETHKQQIFRQDYVVVRGQKMKPPKFYFGQFEMEKPADARRLKAARQVEGDNNKTNNTHERLKAKEFIVKQRTKQLKRTYESES